MHIILGQGVRLQVSPFVNQEGKRVVARLQGMDAFSGSGEVDAFVLQEDQVPVLHSSITIAPGFREWFSTGDHAVLGVGTHTLQEAARFRQAKTRVYTLKTLDFEGLDAVCDGVMQYSRSLERPALVIDLTALNRAEFAGGMLGGLTVREMLYCVHRMKHLSHKGPLIIVVAGTAWEAPVRLILGAWA